MKFKSLYKIIVILSITGLIMPSLASLAFSGPNGAVFAQEPISPPETLNEAKEKGIVAIKKTVEELPAKLKEIWKSKIYPIWRGMWDWGKDFWNSYFKAKFENLWIEIKSTFKKEAEKRKPIIEEEFEKEKQEMKQEIKKEIKEEVSKTGQSIWERFKDLLK